MKKIVTFLLITVYSCAMAGATVAMHYCMGEKVSTSLGYEEQSTCEFCHMEKHSVQDQSDCCMDDHQFIKISSDQDLASFVAAPQVQVLFLNTFLFNPASADSFNHSNTDRKQDIVPPDIAVYQLNCNFRI